MSAPSPVIVETEIRWNPARGPVAMYCLIAAEAAIFRNLCRCLHFFTLEKALPGLNRVIFSISLYSRRFVCSPAV